MDLSFRNTTCLSEPIKRQSHFNFVSIILINTLFFSGYFILKIPLALILASEGMPINDAYSINTTASSLLAVSSIYFGFTLHSCAKKKFALYVGLALCVLSIFLLSLKINKLNIPAIALYVLGGGLYFFNLIMFINKQFADEQARVKGNYIYLIFVNLAGVMGCFFFLSQLHKENVFKYCLISCICSLFIYTFLYPKMEEEKTNGDNLWVFFSLLAILLAGILVVLKHAEFMRLLVLVLFCLASLYVIYLFCREKNHQLLLFVSLVYLFNIPYWIANTLIFNELIYFISNDVLTIKGFSPTWLMIIEPLINTLFGVMLFFWFQNRVVNHYRNLVLSILLMAIAFGILVIGLYINKNANALSYIYPLLTIVIFACAEFLLQSTLNSRIKDLLGKSRRDEFLGTGIFRSSRAFAHVIGYYLISLLTIDTSSKLKVMTANFNLYMVMMTITLVSLIVFTIIRWSRLGMVL